MVQERSVIVRLQAEESVEVEGFTLERSIPSGPCRKRKVWGRGGYPWFRLGNGEADGKNGERRRGGFDSRKRAWQRSP